MPSAFAFVSVAGRFTPRFIDVVGSPINWLVLIRTGSNPAVVSRENSATVPSGLAGQPKSTRPLSVLRRPSASVRNDPVVVSNIWLLALPALISLPRATGNIPRPRTARSVAFDVVVGEPP